MPPPLTAGKLTLVRSQSTSSTASSYPQIPLRQSSLSASLRDGTSGQGLSTRTPSLSESRRQIRVVKIRERNAWASQYPNGGDLNPAEDPFDDKVTTPCSAFLCFLADIAIQNSRFFVEEQQANQARNRYRARPRLTIRWGSGSWNSSGLSPPSILTSASLSSRPPTPQIRTLQYSQLKSEYLSPMELPVAFVDVTSTTSRPQIGLGPVSLWTNVHVSADVSSVPFPGTSGLAPLDVIILLDSL
jgi:hypothetical protein